MVPNQKSPCTVLKRWLEPALYTGDEGGHCEILPQTKPIVATNTLAKWIMPVSFVYYFSALLFKKSYLQLHKHTYKFYKDHPQTL